MDTRFKLENLLPVASLIIFSVLLSGCENRTALLVRDSSSSIALERTGVDGEYDSSGLAKRVLKALAQDSTLSDISTVYAAQNDSKIILKGTVPNKTLLDRIAIVAREVEGVSEVDISQIEIR